MDHVLLIRAGGLYLPITAALLIAAVRRPRTRQALAILLSFLWCLCALLALQLINLRFEFWSFHASGGLLRGMPVDLYLGWAVLWGVLPVMLFRRLPLIAVAAIMGVLDLVAMRFCAPVVVLNRHWLAGEVFALVFVLAPALLLARWTANNLQLAARAAMLVVLSGGMFLFLLPEIIFAATGGGSWSVFGAHTKYALGLEFQLCGVLALLGISAVQEFVHRGGGSPIPFDPPQRLVVSGVFRYVANPMQLSSVLVIGAWGAMLRNFWISGAAVVGVAYGLGIAGWDERADLESRFGPAYQRYRAAVRNWRIGWRPWHDPELAPARLYVAESCGPCSEVRRWIECRKPIGLMVLAAEHHPVRDLTRITYDPGDGTPEEEGVAAFARALEHLNLGWAYGGFFFRLPVIRQFVQLLLDATGQGPQTIPRTQACTGLQPQPPTSERACDRVRLGDWQISNYFWEERRQHPIVSRAVSK